MTEAELIAVVEAQARDLCEAVKAANEAGVSEALLLPALIDVFKQAGMLPEIDFASLLGMIR